MQVNESKLAVRAERVVGHRHKALALQGQAARNIPQQPLQGPFQQGMLLLALFGAWFLGNPRARTWSRHHRVCWSGLRARERGREQEGDLAGVNHYGQEAPETSQNCPSQSWSTRAFPSSLLEAKAGPVTAYFYTCCV